MLFQSLLFKFQIDLIYFTGDIVSHKGWETTRAYNTDAVRKLYHQLKDTFGNISIYSVLGNHDAHPSDAYVFDNLDDQFCL